MLDIFIPTYNRPKELRENLEILIAEYFSLPENERNGVRFHVSDNCTESENVEVLVSKFTELGLPVEYTTHSTNIGAIANIEYCFSQSTADYILILSDDDFFTDGALNNLLRTLNNLKPDLLFMPFLGSQKINNQGNSAIEKIMERNDFLTTVSVNGTLLSALVFNNNIVRSVPISDDPANMFPHYRYLLYSLEKGQSFIYMNIQMLKLLYPYNSGGYNWFQAFGNHFAKLLDSFSASKITTRSLRTVKADMLIRMVIPTFYNKRAYGQTPGRAFELDSDYDIVRIVSRCYFNCAYFWLLFVPIAFIPPCFLRAIKGVYRYLNIKVISRRRT